MYIIATDLDGTLLKSDGTLDEIDLKFINSLKDKDILFIPISSRSYNAMPSFIKENVLYCAGCNGATIYETKTNKVLNKNLLSEKIVLKILDMIKDYYFATTISQDGQMYSDEKLLEIYSHTHSSAYVNQFYKIRKIKKDLMQDYNNEPVEKLHLNFFDDKTRKEVKDIIKDIKDIAITSSGNYNIEITNPKATKGEVIEYFKQKYNVKSENCFAFGDNLNDAIMYDYVDNKVAVKNALDALKERANIITKDDNDHGGVINYIKERLNV